MDIEYLENKFVFIFRGTNEFFSLSLNEKEVKKKMEKKMEKK